MLITSIELLFQQIPAISYHFTDIFEDEDHLSHKEVMIVERASAKRRSEFSTGRYCALKALTRCISYKTEILQGKGREPLWPKGIVGSISHSSKLAGAVVALEHDITAIGLDIETLKGLKPEMWNLIFHDAEQQLILSKQNDAAKWATLIFSLKESFYKLQYPLTRQFLDFRDILISEKNGELCFSNTNICNNLYPVVFNDIETRWAIVGDQLISLCFIRHTITKL